MDPVQVFLNPVSPKEAALSPRLMTAPKTCATIARRTSWQHDPAVLTCGSNSFKKQSSPNAEKNLGSNLSQ